MIDVFAQYSTDSALADWIYVIATIVVGIAYSLYLYRLKPEETNEKEQKGKYDE